MKPPEGANPPRDLSKTAKPAKKSPGAEGIDLGDSVYVRHPKRGAMAVTVSAVGKHGFTARCENGERHRVPWDGYLGHRARMLHRYELVEQGADGALVKDGAGRHRFMAGLELPTPEETTAAENAEAHDDPIVGGLDKLMAKNLETPMLPPLPPGTRILLLKAQVANRPGLALQQVTDRSGNRTQRWKHTGPDGADQPRAPMRHGDVVQFRHKDVAGEGKIVASGADGVTVKDGAGRDHQVRHEHLIHPDDAKAAEEAGQHPVPAAGTSGPAPDAQTGAGGDGSGSGDGGGQIPPDQFRASDWYAQHDRPAECTPGAAFAGFPPDTSAKMAKAVDDLKAVLAKGDTQAKFKKGGKYTPERSKLHAKIISSFLNEKTVASARPQEGQKPSFTILGGRGGSGKSWFKGQVYDPSKAIVLDADAIKEALPEYKGWNAGEVHEESGDLFDQITDLAQKAGLNIVHDATMKSPDKATKLVQRFKSAGYQTEAHYMHLPRQDAAKRAVGRYVNKGRLVPPEVVFGNTQNEQSFDNIKPLVDKWSFRDNQGDGGAGPRLISESQNVSNQGTNQNEGQGGSGSDPAGSGGQDGRHGQQAGGNGDGGGNAAGSGGAAGLPGGGKRQLRKAEGDPLPLVFLRSPRPDTGQGREK